jgi:hypothetical protein
MKMENIATLSLMERILFLKRVPLFENLAPGDIKQVAALAQGDLEEGQGTIVQEGDIDADVHYYFERCNCDLEVKRCGNRGARLGVCGEMALIWDRSATSMLWDVRTLH